MHAVPAAAFPGGGVRGPGDRTPAGVPVSSTEDVYARLREIILSGEISPNAVLSQVRLAQSLGVSVTPVREAMRLLQAEGYLTARHNRRARVAPVDPREVDSVYACRIVTEGLAARLAATSVAVRDLAVLRERLAGLSAAARAADMPAWEALHRDFHRLLAAGCDDTLLALTGPMADRCERYRRVARADFDPQALLLSNDEHEQIVAAYAAREAGRAAALLAGHLARSAMTVLGKIDPAHHPAAITAALAQVRRGDTAVA
jgi:DNA-binding GntR family transcriptional regulator